MPVFSLLAGGCLDVQGESDDSGDSVGTTPDTATTDHKDRGMQESNDSRNDDSEDGDGTPPDTTTTDHEDSDMQPGTDTRFTVLDVRITDVEESVSVIFEKNTVTVTGRILGNNTCYTARLQEVKTADRTMLVEIESYEDAGEDGGCFAAEVEIKYELLVEFEGESPASVTVRHNGEVVTTEHRS